MTNPTQEQIIEFLRESNAIESVYSDEMLQQSLYAWEYLIQQDNLNTPVVLKVHKILMLKSNLFPDEKGYYRRCPVYIGGKEAMQYARIRDHLRIWCRDMNRQGGTSVTDNELDAKLRHVQYEKIHPFVDGNGRTGRMFMNWHRLKKLSLPILIVHSGREQLEYYKWFK